MANYNLIVNSKFQPFSLERYLKPYQIYGEAYNNLENQYNDLTARAETVESMANEQTDPIAYNRYKNYSNKLREVVDSLATRGLNPTSRGSLMGLRRGYIKDIVPIQKAYETRQKYIDEQRQLNAKDNSIMYDRVASQMSLDDLMANPSMSYTPVSGNQIKARVADALKNYKGQLMQNNRIGNWHTTAGGQLLERISRRGLTREDLVEIQTNPNKYPEITNIINNAVLSTGIQNWNDRNALTNAYRYAYEGLPYGLGDFAPEVRENKEYLNAYERWKWQREMNPMPQMEGSTIRPWGMELVNKDLNEGYKGLLSNLVSKGGRGLNPAYAGKKFINPLKIKEEYEKYAKEHPTKKKEYKAHTFASTTTGAGTTMSFSTHKPGYEEAMNYIKKKYGVTKILSDQEYNTAKQLGFTNKSTFKEMSGTAISDKINASVLANSPTSLNLTDYKYVTDILAPTLGRLDEESQRNYAYSLEDGLKSGNGETYEDIFGPKEDEDGNPRKPNSIKDVAYSAVHPGMLIITTDKAHLVNPTLMGQTWVNAIKDNTKNINLLDNNLKGEKQLIVAEELQGLANVKQGIPGVTMSQEK